MIYHAVCGVDQFPECLVVLFQYEEKLFGFRAFGEIREPAEVA